ncbi:MAG: 3-hydroxyacyl-CoA dehydrogenase/enoyl-CoA hydratase family protein [Gammaproteobacteria bacterium]|nr:3-hydroxyacyl-CoA dehydrogenase/enoyl-CoA hydratase family protein [Gammaproteobacteria bacterium]
MTATDKQLLSNNATEKDQSHSRQGDRLLDCTRRIRRVAVLGAGVMGAQIAAHLANAGLQVLLFELPAEDEDKNAHAKQGLKGLTRLKPNPLAIAGVLQNIEAVNYGRHLPRLSECDLVIEAIVERLDLKHDLYKKVVPHLGKHTILATNTSGIGIHQLAQDLPDEIKQRFCALHFFNPPRYMHLLEVIPHRQTREDVIRLLEGFVTTSLGKGVVKAKDTCSFIGNRIGVFALLAVMHHAQRLGLPPDLVDKLTGTGIGRPKSATFRTLDVVGLDVFAHVVQTLADDTKADPWHTYYRISPWIRTLIEQGALGQKRRVGVYQKQDKEIHVFDPSIQGYRRVSSALDERLREILKIPVVADKYQALLDYDHPQADFLLSIFADLFHFCAYHLKEIAHSARDVDLALRWGYGWSMGPFEIWQAAGWQDVSARVLDRIRAGKTMSKAPLPQWVSEIERGGVHGPEGSWSADREQVIPRSAHPVYNRQHFPERLLGEPSPVTETVFETETVRLWHNGDQIAVLGFKTKMHTVSDAVLEGVIRAVKAAEDDFKALVIWQSQAPFCAGANLLEVLTQMHSGESAGVEDVVRKFQQASMALKHAMIPTVAAVQGMALGGGCEFVMHCDRVVAALESYIGLVEVGVGLIPAGGGCKELVLRAADAAQGDDVFPFIARFFERVALGKVSGSAMEARQWGYLRPADRVVLNHHELLHVAKSEALALYEGNYRPPVLRRDIPVAGVAGAATLGAQLVNMRKGGFISEHDYEIGSRLASIFCGGDVDAGSRVSDEWLLRLEVEAFMRLLEMDKSQQRIQHMLEKGRPLRN